LAVWVKVVIKKMGGVYWLILFELEAQYLARPREQKSTRKTP